MLTYSTTRTYLKYDIIYEINSPTTTQTTFAIPTTVPATFESILKSITGKTST